jgi:hypothetical protein
MRCRRQVLDVEIGNEIEFVLLNRLFLKGVPPETWARFGAPFFSRLSQLDASMHCGR